MGEIVFTHCYCRVGPTSGTGLVNMTTQVDSAVINYKAELKDFTPYAVGSNKRKAGLKDWSIKLNVFQNFGSSDVDKFLFDRIGSTSCWVQIRPTTANQGTTNPSYEGQCLLEDYTPILGKVGDAGIIPLSFLADGVLHRTVAAS